MLVQDSRHSVLSKARPLAQSALESFLDGESRRLPPAEFGTYEVREVDVRTALTRCRMPGEPWSLNPYTGCSHACAYCYVPDVAHVERPRWGSYVLVKRNLPLVLQRELKRRERRDVFLSSATDPYQPVEAEHRVTRRSLELLLRARWPVSVLTRSPLVRRDLDLLTAFEEIDVGMSVPTLDDDLRRRIEPGAPPIEGRLRTLRALADAGLRPYANLMPCYPLSGGVTPDDVARAFRDAGVEVVNAGGWRYLASLEPFLRASLGADAERFLAEVSDRAAMERMLRSLDAAFRRAGVAFRW